MVRTAILALNDPETGGSYHDGALPIIRQQLEQGPFVEVDYQAVANQKAILRSKLRLWSDGDFVDLILTLGGIGLSVHDRVPDATEEVVERMVPGLAELMRLAWAGNDRQAALSRAMAGVRNRTLIVNLPGSADEATLVFGSVVEILPVAVDYIVGTDQPNISN